MKETDPIWHSNYKFSASLEVKNFFFELNFQCPFQNFAIVSYLEIKKIQATQPVLFSEATFLGFTTRKLFIFEE